jgi:hypothetical protein
VSNPSEGLDEDEDAGSDYPRDRAKDIAERPLSPMSLCGSYFLAVENDSIVRHGIVVGEPQSGLYLLQLYGWDAGGGTHQTLVPVTEMVDGTWRFYDTIEDLETASKPYVKATESERG